MSDMTRAELKRERDRLAQEGQWEAAEAIQEQLFPGSTEVAREFMPEVKPAD